MDSLMELFLMPKYENLKKMNYHQDFNAFRALGLNSPPKPFKNTKNPQKLSLTNSQKWALIAPKEPFERKTKENMSVYGLRTL